MKHKYQKQKYIYIGLDLHKMTHTAVGIDCWNEALFELTFDNRPTAFPKLLEIVDKHTDGLTPIFGLEDTGGFGRSLAVYLIENNHIVKEVNSALSSSERKSYLTTQKSDSWDARCIASVLLSKLNTLPDANPQDLYWTVSQLVSRRDALVKSSSAISNQPVLYQINYMHSSNITTPATLSSLLTPAVIRPYNSGRNTRRHIRSTM